MKERTLGRGIINLLNSFVRVEDSFRFSYQDSGASVAESLPETIAIS